MLKKCLLLPNFTEVSKGRDWPSQEKNTAIKKKNKSGNMCSGDGRGTVLLFTEEVVSNNTDILALIFYHYYSSRKGKGLPITCHEDTAGKQIYSFAHS